MADKAFKIQETLSSDTNTTDQLVSSGGPVLFSVQRTAGTGDAKMQKSLDGGTTWSDVELSNFTGMSASDDLYELTVDSVEGDRFRGNLSNSASTPSFVFRIGLATIKNAGNRT